MKSWWVWVVMAGCRGDEPSPPPRREPVFEVPAPSPRTLAIGDGFACAITGEHRVRCWGNAPTGFAAIADATQLAIGSHRACVVRSLGEVACLDGAIAGIPPATRLAMTDERGCIAVADGAAWCWSAGGKPVRIAAIHDAIDVAVDETGGCALRATGRVACFPIAADATPVELPTERVVELIVAPGAKLLRTADEHVQVYVRDAKVGYDVATAPGAPPGTFGWIALRLLDGSVANIAAPWPYNATAKATLTTLPQLHDVAEVALGAGVACAAFRVGGIACWGDDGGSGIIDRGRPQIQLAPHVVSLPAAVALHRQCAVLEDGLIFCWGEDGTKAWEPPPREHPDDPFVDLSFGAGACARTRGGFVDCWHGGDPRTYRMSGVTHAVAISGDHEKGCALSRGGTVACWQGFDAPASSATPEPLAEPAVQVASYGLDECARLASGRVQCAGDFDDATLAKLRGITDAVDLVVETGALCVIRRAHPTWCSRPDDTSGTARMLAAIPPGSSLVSLGADAWDDRGLVCFADAAHRVACLGGAMFPADPRTPHVIADAGTPLAISAGVDSACVLRTDHTIACFGAWAKGQLGDGTTSATQTPVTVR